MRILENIMLRIRTFVLILIMLGLPLQGVLAAIMPLCAEAKNMAAGPEAEIPSVIIPSAACAQHDDTREPSVDNDGPVNEANFSLSCDGVVCHISGTGLLPPAASLLNLAVGHSYAISSDSRFTSSFPQQPQRPPLA